MTRSITALWAACVTLAAIAGAEELRLKTRTIDPAKESSPGLELRAAGMNPRSLTGSRWHWLIQVNSSDLSAWEQRGATILASVPVNGYIISAPDTMNWQDLDYKYRAPIQATDKISPQVLSAELIVGDEIASSLAIVRFHKDVAPWEADGILDAEGVRGIRNASLETEDRLIEVAPAQMHALAAWDEVEYVFPAPQGMKDGEPFLVCGGVLSGAYEVAMLAASYGEGWDGPGRGRASISYSFGNLGTRTDVIQTKAEFRRALEQWARAAAVTFTETTARSAARNIDLMFATGDHGDPFPFTSGTSVLAHSFYPAPPNPEPIAGDIHVNDAWSWSIGGQWDVFSVVLHELGHSLGIGHTDTPGSVMYPYYQKATELKQPDIDSIRQIYAAPDTTAPLALSITIANPGEGARVTTPTVNVSGSITGGGSGMRVEYTNASASASGACLINSVFTTYSCAAVPVTNGANTIRVEAKLDAVTASAERTISREAPGDVLIAVTSPVTATTTTTASQIQATGTASHPGGIASVTWVTSKGKSGSATGLETWQATVPLETGVNAITFTVTSRTGIQSSRTISIERTAATAPAPPPDPTGDKTPPRMTIQQPIGNFIITTASKLTFRGTATDNIGVQQVTWTNSAGMQSGTAQANQSAGATNWSFDVSIAVGFNAIQVRAWDTSGNSTLYTTTVRRY